MEIDHIKDLIKRTVTKLAEEKQDDDLLMGKMFIIFNKVLSLCDYNHFLVENIFKEVLVEVQKEALGDFGYILHKIRERMVRSA